MLGKQERYQIIDQFITDLPPQPPADGILVVDKPSGSTSHDLVYAVRRKYGIKKIGHTGTLDPLASGLMILLIGSATKRAAEFSGLDKAYQVKAKLGQITDSFDIEGQILFDIFNRESTLANDIPIRKSLEVNWDDLKNSEELGSLTDKTIEQALEDFRSQLNQRVPPFSAVKLNGKPLYKYAREGKPIPFERLPTRDIVIHEIKLLDFKPHDKNRNNGYDEIHSSVISDPLSGAEIQPAVYGSPNTGLYPTLRLHISCSKGTYIRSLVHDLGL
ncbi:MAG TPA: hypothetical protein ENN77_02855, partial [Candidatus Wirthbacteria bacterium]|nr:hypothetical protein [Candidatus Wirthbacteria bacterium]